MISYSEPSNTYTHVDQLCPVELYVIVEMFNIYIVQFGSHQSDVVISTWNVDSGILELNKFYLILINLNYFSV